MAEISQEVLCASNLNSYFASITSENHAVAHDSVVPLSPSVHVDVCDLPLISPSTCSALLSELKPKTSSGVDIVSAVVLRSSPETLSIPPWPPLSTPLLLQLPFLVSGSQLLFTLFTRRVPLLPVQTTALYRCFQQPAK